MMRNHSHRPDGTGVTQGQGELNDLLSQVLQRPVTLQAAERGHAEVVESTFPNPWAASAEEYWPDREGLDYRDTVTDFALPAGTFFDAAAVHVLPTATLDRLRELSPPGRFEAQRFRPNLVVAPVHAVQTSSKPAGSTTRSRSGRRAPVRHGWLPAVRADDARPGGSALGSGHPTHGRAAQPRHCRRLCRGGAGRPDPPGRSRAARLTCSPPARSRPGGYWRCSC